jgi:nucleoid DNA-binding protein
VLGDLTQEDLQKQIKLKSKHLSQRYREDDIEASVQNTLEYAIKNLVSQQKFNLKNFSLV